MRTHKEVSTRSRLSAKTTLRTSTEVLPPAPVSTTSDIVAQIMFNLRVRDQFKRGELVLDAQKKALTRLYGEADASMLELPFISAYRGFHTDALKYTKVVENLAKQLPVWPWWEKIRGVGPLALAEIVGETGDLTNYANPAKVWKRMGVGLVNGERQKRVAHNGELATMMAYSPRRRARLHNIGDALIKQNRGKYKEYMTTERLKKDKKIPVKLKMSIISVLCVIWKNGYSKIYGKPGIAMPKFGAVEYQTRVSFHGGRFQRRVKWALKS